MKVLFALLLATAARAEDVSGRVFETTDVGRVPSADAFVVVHWIGRRPNLWHYESVCIQAAIAVWKPCYDEQARQAGEWTLVPSNAATTRATDPQGVLPDFHRALAEARRAR